MSCISQFSFFHPFPCSLPLVLPHPSFPASLPAGAAQGQAGSCPLVCLQQPDNIFCSPLSWHAGGKILGVLALFLVMVWYSIYREDRYIQL